MAAPVSKGFTDQRWGKTFTPAAPLPWDQTGRPTPRGREGSWQIRDLLVASTIQDTCGYLGGRTPCGVNGEVRKTGINTGKETLTKTTRTTKKNNKPEITSLWNMPIVELHLVKRGQKKSEGRHPKSQRSVGISGTVQYAVAAKQSACRAFQYYGSTTHFNGFFL